MPGSLRKSKTEFARAIRREAEECVDRQHGMLIAALAKIVEGASLREAFGQACIWADWENGKKTPSSFRKAVEAMNARPVEANIADWRLSPLRCRGES